MTILSELLTDLLEDILSTDLVSDGVSDVASAAFVATVLQLSTPFGERSTR